MAQPRELARQSESEIHRVADSHSAKLSVAIRYAFASARAAMRRKLLSRADIKEATALGIVTLRQELKEILPKALRKIYVEGGELAASQLAGEVRAAGDYEGHPFRGNQWTEGADGDGEIDRSVPTVPRDSQGTLLDKNGEPLTVYHGSVSREVDATTLDLRDPVRPRPGQLDGIYFTSDPRAASSYTRVIGVKAPAGRIVSAQIRMQNPKDITKDIKAGQKRGLTFGDAKREALKSVTAEHDGVVFRGDQYNADEYMVRSRDQIRAVKPRSLADWRFAKREPKPKFKIDFAFDKETQSAIDWADRHAAELITQISETSREDINNAVAEFLETGDFKELRDEILAAVGDSRRADLIARNEPMRAVHEGQREAWKQAVDEGLLEENAVREWIVVGDDKVCPICEGLEGQTAELSGEYPGGYDGPPAHVSCRCSESISGHRVLGGQGSGNFGHAGRPGEVGGSAPDGSPEANSPEDAKRIIEEEQKKWLTPEEFEKLPPGIRAWKTRTRREKAEGKEPEKPKEKPKEPEKPKEVEKPVVVGATKAREEAIVKRREELYDQGGRRPGQSYKDALAQALREDAEKYGPLPDNSLLKRREAINARTDELRKEIGDKLTAEGKSKEGLFEKAYKQAQAEDVAKWGPWAYPEEVAAIRESDANWSPAKQLAERDSPDRTADVTDYLPRDTVAPEHQSAKQREVQQVADNIARDMKFEPALIIARDRGKDPRTFELNGKRLTEGGHYNPQTGQIEVNANFGVDRGLIMHEIHHAQWDYVRTQAEEEASALRARWAREQAADFSGTRYFLKNGKVMAKYRDEFEKQMPHTSVLARAGMGSKELGIKQDFAALKADDGVSQYSAEYWTQAATKGGFNKDVVTYLGERAIDETLAEITRRTAGHSRMGDSSFGLPTRFLKFRKDVESLYSKDPVRVQRHFSRRQKQREFIKDLDKDLIKK